MTLQVIDRMTRPIEDETRPLSVVARSPVLVVKEILMSNLIQPSVFLRRALLADALVSTLVGVVLTLGFTALREPLGLPMSVLTLASAASLPYAGYLLWLATRAAVPRAAVWVPIVLNVVWAAEFLLLAFSVDPSPTPLGRAFMAVQVIGALLFAELELIGLRRACAIVAA